jgi:replicative DNA helicase
MALSTQTKALHKSPPNNLDAEQSVLGGILIEKDAINAVLEILAHDGSDFYHDANARLFDSMVSLSEKCIPIERPTSPPPGTPGSIR